MLNCTGHEPVAKGMVVGRMVMGIGCSSPGHRVVAAPHAVVGCGFSSGGHGQQLFLEQSQVVAALHTVV